jgi:hypothetical protein
MISAACARGADQELHALVEKVPTGGCEASEQLFVDYFAEAIFAIVVGRILLDDGGPVWAPNLNTSCHALRK